MIIRSHHGKDPFARVRRSLLVDGRISFKAKGIAGYLLAQVDEWTPNVRHLATVGPDGRESVSSGLRELEQFFYFRRSKSKDPETGQWVWEGDLYEIYEENPAWLELSPEQQQALSAPVPCTENRDMDTDPCTGFPYTGNPATGKPATGNPSLITNELTTNELTKVSSSSSSEDTTGNRQVAANEENIGKFFDFWIQNMPGTMTEYIKEQLLDLIKDYGLFEVHYATEQAIVMNKRFMKYVEGICKRRAAGTEEESNANNRRSNQKGSGKSGARAVPAKPGQERFASLLE